jgi:ribosomal RNA-processing protein 9
MLLQRPPSSRGTGVEIDKLLTTMSSFFTEPRAHKKRKRIAVSERSQKRATATKSNRNSYSKRPAKTTANLERDESISGSDLDEFDDAEEVLDGSSTSVASDSEGETAAERRRLLAERYLENVKQEIDENGFDAEDIDKDLIAERLQQDVAESKGKIYRQLAEELDFSQASSCHFKWNSDSITGVATCPPYAYTVSKDIYLSKWRIQSLPQHQWPQRTKKKQKKPDAPPKKRPDRLVFRRGDRRKSGDKSFQGHTGSILAVAASQDGRFVATAGEDHRLIIYSAETLKPLKVFLHHKARITGLAFRRGTNQLYSCSAHPDRTVRVWSLDELAHIQNLFGHEDDVMDIAALAQERCISVGRDRTARLWKVAEETQLKFTGGSSKKTPEGMNPRSDPRETSIDRVAMLDDELFITGSDNGALSLWSISRKKPLFVIPRAHGLEELLKATEVSAEENPEKADLPAPQPRWITALKTVPYSDVILSGSWDGYVRAWRLSEDKRRLEPIGTLGIAGGSEKDIDVQGNDLNGAGKWAPKANDKSRVIRGVINDISVFERGERGKDGLCVVVAVGREHRLGEWIKIPGARNGAVVFEVPRFAKDKKSNSTLC